MILFYPARHEGFVRVLAHPSEDIARDGGEGKPIMRTWLKRMVAGIVSAGTLMGGGLLMAGTANADEIRMPDIGKTITSLTASAATTYPRELVNGDFEYPSMKSLQHYFTGIDRNRSQWISNGQGDDLAKWSDIPGGLDTTRFGWSSTQTQGAMSEQRANAVELQKATGETTQMGELCASQKGTAIYQDIATTPGTLYRIELDHASRYRIHLDQMQVMVGAPGHEQPVEMTRTSSNKYGDKIGEKSTTIATHSTNPFGNQSSKDDFSHYVGYYTIPAGQSVTRFTFRQVSGVNTTSGNLLDNIVFTQAYKLDYDRNSDEATGQTPNDTATVNPAKTSATGGVKNVADTNASLPGHLVNGDFEYLPDGGWKTVDAPSYMTNAYTSVDPNNGQYMRNAQHSDADLASWADWPGFDQSKFAWKTDQKGGHDQGGLKDRAEAVELQQDSMDGNTYAEMVASETGRTIYQNLATIPGTLYKIRLKHASLCKDNVDQMQVVINGTPIEMTRVAANGKAGDKVGEKSKTIGTRVTNGNRWHHSDQWETYEGYYVIPDGQTTTRFGFKAVNYLDPTKGNLLDDVTFARAYKLSYDKNASDATGKVPSDETAGTVRQTKTKTTGTVKTVADENVRYGSLANGDFSYPSFSDIQENEQGTYADLRTFLKSDDGTLWYNMSTTDLSKYGKIGQIPGFDSSRFAWSSTENGSRVELQQDRNTKNTYAEIVAQQDNTSIYQNVSTGNGGVLYKIRLKHASRQSSHADRMQVLVGADAAHATPVEMTRVTSNGHGDKVGGKSTIITTKVSNTDPRDHGAQWETYEGYYQVPEGQKNTVFMFKSLEGFKEVETLSGNNVGNLVDDIEFSRSYKLTYDKNSDDATGSVPSDTTANTVKQAKAKTSGTVKTVADDDSSKSLTVNPGFDVPDYSKLDDGGLHWMYVNPSEGNAWSYYDYINPSAPKHQVAGLSQATFGWQELTGSFHATTSFELHREKDGNVCADVHGSRTIGQTIDTQAGVAYTVSIRHSGRSKGNAGSVQVLVGPDKDHLQPLEMSRMNVSRTGAKYGDKTGKVGTVITTHSDSVDSTEGDHPAWDHSDDWETYSGTYVATGGKTVFAYRGVDENGDSVIDDLSFKLAYRLSYDKNAADAAGSIPSDEYGKENTVRQAKSKANGSVKLVADDDVAEYAANGLPRQIMNGDFDHDWRNIVGQSRMSAKYNFANIDPAHGDVEISGALNGKGEASKQWVHLNGFDANKFGWKSNQTDTRVDGRGGIVEIQRSRANDNMYAEITASQANTYLYQDIDTAHSVPTVYTVKLRYAHRNGTVDSNEKIQILVGAPGHEQPVEMTRIASDRGNKVGEKSTTVNAPNTDGWLGSWDTFQGSVEIPAGQPVSRFTFKALGSIDGVTGNLIDDVQFKLAYPLSYDKNAQDATGSVPSSQYGKENTVQPAKAKTTGSVRLAADKTASGQVPSNTTPDTTQTASSNSTGKVSDLVQRTTTHEDGSVTVRTIDTSTDVVSGCQVYYPAGQRITLATLAKDDDCWDSSMLSRPGHTQLGWNQDRNATQAQAEVTMVEGGMTVFAVWVGNPVLTYDTNKPSTWSGEMPSTPASVSVPYNTAAADGSGWQAGDVSKLRGYKFLGWYTGPQDNAGLYDWTRPLTGSVTVYAHWQRLQANVIYNANGGTGSHANTTGWQYSDVTVPGDTSKSFKRDGYYFKYWNTQKDGKGTTYKDGGQVPLQDKDVTLYAIWAPYHTVITETGGVGLPVLVAAGMGLLVVGIGSTVMLTRRMRGEQ